MRRRIAGIVLALCAPLALGVDRPGGLGDVVEVRHWSYPDYTRVVVELDRAVVLKGSPQRLPARRSFLKSHSVLIWPPAQILLSPCRMPACLLP